MQKNKLFVMEFVVNSQQCFLDLLLKGANKNLTTEGMTKSKKLSSP
jgi:hypothetical protein